MPLTPHESLARCLLLDARNSLRLKLAALVGKHAWAPKQPLLAWTLSVDKSVMLMSLTLFSEKCDEGVKRFQDDSTLQRKFVSLNSFCWLVLLRIKLEEREGEAES